MKFFLAFRRKVWYKFAVSKFWKVFRAYAPTPFLPNIFQRERSAPTQQTQHFCGTQLIIFSENAIEQRAFPKHFPKARNSWRCEARGKGYCRACLHTACGFETVLYTRIILLSTSSRACLHTVYGFETELASSLISWLSKVAHASIPFTVLKLVDINPIKHLFRCRACLHTERQLVMRNAKCVMRNETTDTRSNYALTLYRLRF